LGKIFTERKGHGSGWRAKSSAVALLWREREEESRKNKGGRRKTPNELV
jgi:hypothetical protein